MVFEGGEPLIILGAPGGTQIAMGVLQVLLNMLDFKMPVVEAVSAPRFSATSNAIDITRLESCDRISDITRRYACGSTQTEAWMQDKRTLMKATTGIEEETYLDENPYS